MREAFTQQFADQQLARARAGWGRGSSAPHREVAPGHVKITHKDLVRQIRDLLNYHHIFHWKAWQGPMSTPGIADIIGCHRGRMLVIEAKVGRDKTSPAQEKFLKRVAQEGGIAIVAYSVDAVIGQLGLEMPLFGNKNPAEAGRGGEG
jgi:hypothetical protein